MRMSNNKRKSIKMKGKIKEKYNEKTTRKSNIES